MGQETISVRDVDGLKARLEVLAHDYRMNFSLLIREMLEQAFAKWQAALDEERAGLVP